MPGTITPGRIKDNNRMLIYQLIYQKKELSQLDISYMLHLSRPTVTGKLTELMEDGLIVKSGLIPTDQLGRKAAAYSIASEYRIAIGVQITTLSIYMMAVNLYGDEIAYSVYSAEYQNKDAYYEKICRFMEEFILSVTPDRSSVLGIGIGMDAVPSPDGLHIVPGGPMDNVGLSVSVFQDRLQIPCRFIKEADCAAVTDIWTYPEPATRYYLYLSYHLSSAVVCEGSLIAGKHARCGEIAHVPFKKGSKVCYCGKDDCLETVISATALLGKEGMTHFFQELQKKDPDHMERWQHFLEGIAYVAGPSASFFDSDIILGGEIAAFMTEQDLDTLHDLIQKKDRGFVPLDYLQIHPLPPRGVPLGAALPYIWKYLEELPDMQRIS